MKMYIFSYIYMKNIYEKSGKYVEVYMKAKILEILMNKKYNSFMGQCFIHLFEAEDEIYLINFVSFFIYKLCFICSIFSNNFLSSSSKY